MLPKVATNLLHSTVTRSAAAAVQNQANLRNALQLHPTAASTSGSASSSQNPGLFTPSSERPSKVTGSSSSALSASASKANAHGGSHGPGSGGAKKNRAGSRFYTGYNGAARAVTQANALTSQDATVQAEEEEMHPAARRAMLKSSASTPKRTRLRSSSVNNLLGRDKGKERETILLTGEKVSVLKTVQLQARSLHALTAAQQQSQSQSAPAGELVEDLAVAPTTPAPAVELAEVEEAHTPRAPSRSPTPVPSSPRPRRNSISSPVSSPSSPRIHPADILLPASPQLSVRHSSTSASGSSVSEDSLSESASESLSTPPSSTSELEVQSVPKDNSWNGSSERKIQPTRSIYGENILNAALQEDRQAIDRHVKALNSLPVESDTKIYVSDFNVALQALSRFRKPLEPLNLALETYNAMLARSLRPNVRTYAQMIDLFTSRDWETRRIIMSLHSTPESEVKEELAALQAENNFGNAMRLFEAVIAAEAANGLEYVLFKRLLRSAGLHGNLKAALHVLSHAEKRDNIPDPDTYRYLMQAFAKSGDFKGAELVFNKYRGKEAKGEIHAGLGIVQQKAAVYNQMIELYFENREAEKALELLETMLKAPESSAENVTAVPAPSSSTYTTVIGGFIHIGDVQTAVTWFNRLLEQSAPAGEDAFVPSPGGRPMRPDPVAWTLIMDALLRHGMLEDLNRLYVVLVQDRKTYRQTLHSDQSASFDGVKITADLRESVLKANLHALSGLKQDQVAPASQRLDFVREYFFRPSSIWNHHQHNFVWSVSGLYIKFGLLDEASRFVEAVVSAQLEMVNEQKMKFDSAGIVQQMQNLVLSVVESICARSAREGTHWSFAAASSFARLSSEELGLMILPEQSAWLLNSYAKDKAAGLVDPATLTIDTWRILLSAAVYLGRDPSPISKVPGYAFEGIQSLVSDLAASGVAFNDELCDFPARMTIVDLVTRGQDLEWCKDYFFALGESYAQTYDEVVAARYNVLKDQLDAVSTPPTTPTSSIDFVSSPPVKGYGKIAQNMAIGKEIDGLLKAFQTPVNERVDKAYAIFQENLETKKLVPAVQTIGRLIQACGRLNQLDRVSEIYGIAQAFLASVRNKWAESKRRSAWLSVENNMIIGLAQAGDVEAAHVHRLRMLEFCSANNAIINRGTAEEDRAPYLPTADAYGALILHVKETTDDATNALMLWNEALSMGVVPNMYLYNNIISKLARARKADQALELFRGMKAAGIQPSSITYGAVIGACTRVGDAASAEALFKEMSEQSNFKPRVPPFNTMMQFYVATKPNRDQALWYYQEMVRLGIKPTGHTYKLLLDIYGSIEPVDIGAMESVFDQLKADTSVELNGPHFASLINAYGCVQKQLEHAISVFDAIPNHGVARDAVVYEALVNALVANKRTDLIEGFLARMVEDGVHMTAYVANFLIKGWANVGDVEQARVIFESMLDPPTGVAAPNNHAPHEPGAVVNVDVSAPVYREPSTWEAMIRAELGVGNRENAQSLLERLRARQYPEAVFNRISGVMVDHSVPLL
ncbi:hypothetical protein D9611_002963 [Ephemerocybe angulata]|uniref:Pentacotripeptide-repeat region of PRORP domain-containing protein n=1 Tax=Ephemerocybe angulata TaxID=980116 RepID=A0A8H5C8D5_9AGAR|nr:hypothetical protein D9611_002963 [Tulosesus angulatus]